MLGSDSSAATPRNLVSRLLVMAALVAAAALAAGCQQATVSDGAPPQGAESSGAVGNTDGSGDQAAAEAGAGAGDSGEAGAESAAGEGSAAGALADHTEADLITNVRQLILDGERSGEGYFSTDGRRMIFQAERDPDNPFYQMYVMDMDNGDVTRISPGYGKVTCGWLHPNGETILFASTHEDPASEQLMAEELERRAAGEAEGYSFTYDDTFEIYSFGPDGEFVNLTDAPGYDAEGSYSPDGTKIAFTSNRLAYSEPMSDEDREYFDLDESYMADIYIMNADGTDVRQLTDWKGYDGGPFFSPDGERIVWRRFNPEGTLAEIWTMNIDGSDQKPITEMGSMSWAPFYHPSGDYVIYTTNEHGFTNFELYFVDVNGEKEPVRATFTDGADVLPVFTPDGNRLAWVTRRTDGKAQIHIADWDDAKARELLDLSPPRGSVSYETDAEAGEIAPPDMAATSAEYAAADARMHVERLASEEMDGRLTGTPGEAMATEYVAEAFEALGLEPAGDDGYFQPFQFTADVSLVPSAALAAQYEAADEEVDLTLDDDWRPLAFSKTGPVDFAGLAFAGYGIDAPEDGDNPAYDSYGDQDVAGKWVVVLRYLPENVSPELRQHLTNYSSLRFKAMEARDRGATGLIVVSGPASNVKEDLVPLEFDGSVAGTSIPAISVSDELAAQWFELAGTTLADAQVALDAGEIVPGFDLPGVTLGAHFDLEFEEDTGRNVLARLQVADEPSEQVVIVGAHVDHLGHGEGGDSLAKPEEQGQVHYGADDNASGVAGLLEIAQYLSTKDAAGELDDVERDIVFAAWSGEELGLLGSSAYVKELLDEGEETIYPAVAAYLNMDMIGRMRDQVVLQGIGSSSVWPAEIEKRNVPVGLPVKLSEDPYLPTDATSFYLKGVPVLSAFTGVHSEYNTPRDTPDTLDYDSLADIARLMGLITVSIASADAPPDYIEAEAPTTGSSSSGSRRVYLGTIPDMTDTTSGGALISGVSKDGPADQAGMQGGDRIVELAGQPIDNLYDYSHVLNGLKIGETVVIVVLRDGERLSLEITPVSRE
ncbi:MAG: M28 family peptidase [Anaerolineae bacterium]